jgi:hypothetical protein
MIDVKTNYDQADDARQVIHRTKQVTQRQFGPEEIVWIVILSLSDQR